MLQRLVDTQLALTSLKTRLSVLPEALRDKESLVLMGRGALSGERRNLDPMSIEEDDAIGRRITDLAKELASHVDEVTASRDVAVTWLSQRRLILDGDGTRFQDLLLKQEDPVGDCKVLATSIILNRSWQDVCEAVGSVSPELLRRLDTYALDILTMVTALQRVLVSGPIADPHGARPNSSGPTRGRRLPHRQRKP
ncbi:MAG: hypothetical protein NTX53_20185 [candidate division WOR-3 bacterium]|nr:hypothetical protein [candidate division WOR-3 bacterium]